MEAQTSVSQERTKAPSCGLLWYKEAALLLKLIHNQNYLGKTERLWLTGPTYMLPGRWELRDYTGGGKELTDWSFALCSSTFISHWTLHCAVFLQWEWLLQLCLVWTAILWVHVRQACEARGPQGGWEMSICWFWHRRMKIYGHIGMKTIWLSDQVEISAHRVTFIWADSFAFLSYIC